MSVELKYSLTSTFIALALIVAVSLTAVMH